jgi:hypothetical protein
VSFFSNPKVIHTFGFVFEALGRWFRASLRQS